MDVRSGTKERTVANFQMQANGAEMLRLAVILAEEMGLEICATIHDAVLVEATLENLERDARAMQSAMAEASDVVLNGFQLRSDVEFVRAPDHWGDRCGPMWEIVNAACEG